MNYVYKTNKGFRIKDMSSTIKILIDSGYIIENKLIDDKYPCAYIKIIKSNKIGIFMAGDMVWFIYPDQYEEWCRGKTYAFVDDPHTIYYDGSIRFDVSGISDLTSYSRNDCMVTAAALAYCTDRIIKVIFNDPATIIFWGDGTKTVVKCQKGDVFDKEKGLALCISKKYLGNKSNFNNEFKKWIVKEGEEE